MIDKNVKTISGCFNKLLLVLLLVFFFVTGLLPVNHVNAAQLRAGVAKVDITDTTAGPVNDHLYVRALFLNNGETSAVIITLDAVAVGEIGHISNNYMENICSQIEKKLRVKPGNVLINASHCHGVVCSDVDQKTFQAVSEASMNMVPVIVGSGTGFENRIMENRRLKLKNGKQADVRHAYSLVPDEEVTGIGPVDPEIGILRLDRKDGRTLAVVYNFAIHPIQGVPGGGNTADITGFASKVIEDNLSEGTIALFLQGCAGDINPVWYKDVNHPRDAEPLGNMLGLSTLRAVRKIESTRDKRLKVFNEVLALPRADHTQRIIAMEGEQEKLLQSLAGTSINLKTFIPLAVKYKVSGDYPSYYSHGYFFEKMIGKDGLENLDSENQRNMNQYIHNIHIMEQLTRNQTNLALLRKHQASFIADQKATIDVAIMGVRIGDFVLLTFPGELSVQIGMNIKKMSPHELTFVAGYTNGYIYYAPTAEQLRNVGGAQEDSDCLLAPEWQKIYEERMAALLRKL